MTRPQIIELMARAFDEHYKHLGVGPCEIAYKLANVAIDALTAAGLAIVPINPTLEMFEAYHGALKARVEAVPIAERKWKRRITTGDVWSGYRIPPKQKFFWRWEAILKAAKEQEGHE